MPCRRSLATYFLPPAHRSINPSHPHQSIFDGGVRWGGMGGVRWGNDGGMWAMKGGGEWASTIAQWMGGGIAGVYGGHRVARLGLQPIHHCPFPSNPFHGGVPIKDGGGMMGGCGRLSKTLRVPRPGGRTGVFYYRSCRPHPIGPHL